MNTIPLGLLPGRQKLNVDWPAQDQPLVSVVIPTYNRGRYVAEAVMSVVRQTWPKIQLIVIDGGSVDESHAILSRLSKEHGFHFINQTSWGLPEAFNEGLALARGKYFCPFASDDIMLPERLLRQIHVMEKNPSIAVCTANMQFIDSDGRITQRTTGQSSGDITFADFCKFGNTISAPAAMIRKDVLSEVGGYDEGIFIEDYPMWLKLSYHGYRFYRMEDVVVQYRVHSGSRFINRNPVLARRDIVSLYAEYAENQAMRRRLLSFCAKMFWTDPVYAWQTIRRVGGPPMLVSLLARSWLALFHKAGQMSLHTCCRIYRRIRRRILS